MELLTKEYFDRQFAKMENWFSQMLTRKEFETEITLFKEHIDQNFVTKEYLDERLDDVTLALTGHTLDIASEIIEATDKRFEYHEGHQTPTVKNLFLEGLDKKGIKWYNR